MTIVSARIRWARHGCRTKINCTELKEMAWDVFSLLYKIQCDTLFSLSSLFVRHMLVLQCTAQGPHSIETRTMWSAATWIFIDIFRIHSFPKQIRSFRDAFSRYSQMGSSFLYIFCISFSIEMNPFFYSKSIMLRPSKRICISLEDRRVIVHSDRHDSETQYQCILRLNRSLCDWFLNTVLNDTCQLEYRSQRILKPQTCNEISKHNFVDAKSY